MAEYDPHAKKVYDWEDSWPDWEKESLTLPQVREIIHLACEAYGLAPPAVRQHKKGWAYSLTATPPDGSFISFVPKHKNKAIAVHEAAHYIVDMIYGNRTQSHGWTFQGVYFFLLSKLAIAPEIALRASMRPFGLKWHVIPPSKKKEP